MVDEMYIKPDRNMVVEAKNGYQLWELLQKEEPETGIQQVDDNNEQMQVAIELDVDAGLQSTKYEDAFLSHGHGGNKVLYVNDTRCGPWNAATARVLPVAYFPEPVEHIDYDVTRASFSGGHDFRTVSFTGAGYALEGLRFINRTTSQGQLWDAVEKRFYKLAGSNGTVSSADFASCIGMEDSAQFAMELLNALSRRKGNISMESISLTELHDYWLQISDGSFDSRMQLFFDLCDKDLDGRISEEEVKEFIMLSISSNKLSMLQEQAEEYAALIMGELDPQRKGYIELSQLESLFRTAIQGYNRDGYHNNCTQTSIQSKRNRAYRAIRKAKYLILDRRRQICILLLWFAALAGLFTWKFLQYKNRDDFEVMGYCVCTAKGAAETLKLNMALILLPVCRNTITWLRSTIIGSIIPFDDNIKFHKIISSGIALGVIIHAGSHLGCDFPRIANAKHQLFITTEAAHFGDRQPSYMNIFVTPEVITGVIMVILMSFAYLLANHWSRRNLVKLPWPLHRLTGFNAFWYSHHLFLVVYGLLIVHSIYLFLSHEWIQKTTWLYIGVPMILYIGERALRALRAQQYKVNTVKAAIYPGDVLAIHMTKPTGFKYESGMYLFLQCPSISSFEWHPFSITSAPGDDYISVHIRTLGDWTWEMRRVFKDALEYSEKKTPMNDFDGVSEDARFPKLAIDGPYGAPAQNYKKYDVILLIGLGIGATPFISILKDVLNHIKLAESVFDSPTNSSNSISSNSCRSGESPLTNGCNSPLSSTSQSCSSPWISSTPSPKRRKRPRGPMQAYFYWVTREQGSFEWFKGVMNEVAEIDQKAVVEMHNYLTTVYEEGDARSALIMLVQALHRAKSGVDILSGTRVRTHFARPNWQKVFSRLAGQHSNERIGVFYCGPSALAKELNALCKKYTQKSGAKFVFHKENF